MHSMQWLGDVCDSVVTVGPSYGAGHRQWSFHHIFFAALFAV